MTEDLLGILTDLRDRRRPHAVAIVVEIAGSSSAKPGAKAVIDENGRVVKGWVGGGCAESMTCSQALQCLKTGETAVLDIDLNSEVLGAGMPCGGSMRVYVEPVIPRPALWITGHGRIAESLCAIGSMQGLEVRVIDPLVDREKYPDATKLIAQDPDYEQLLPSSEDYVVIATQHKGDHKSMTRALRSEAGYIALIASAKRSRLVLEYLRKQGFGERELSKVRAPAGIDLGARTPEEIALCVISEIVMIRRGGSGQLMRDRLTTDAKTGNHPQSAGTIGIRAT